MKAAVCREFGAPLSLEDVTIAAPEGQAMKVKINACAICHSDITYMRGGWGGTPPLLFGHEAAGTVVETGDGVTSFAAGDRVVVTLMRSCGTCPSCGDELEAICATPPAINEKIITDSADAPVITAMNTGAFAEEVLVHERQCIAIPDELGFDEASLLGCGVITGFGAVTRVGKVQAGETVAVIGTGGIGINAIQAARIAGASTLVAIDTAADKDALARKLGATDFINPAAENAQERIMAITNGTGLDAVFVGVGSSKAIESAIPMVRAGGRIIIMGMPASDDLASIDASDLSGSAKTVIGTKMGSAMIREDIPKLIALYQQGEIALDELISHRFTFDQINAAIDMAASPASSRVVITF
ncbi:MAG: alcohol dehydrogenase catalytic domain-containing protein [Alphaproteobacteria bacterium]|nr:alcohol dehydrogenase catalytic domain-containing protein [Alphaproteobacteria bacterium]